MELTGKAEEDFEFWLFNRNHPEEYYNRELISKTCLNALIIEWFDSVGIYIQPKRFCQGLEFKEWYCIISDTRGVYLYEHLSDCRIKEDSRQEATEQAIIKANEIYNAKTS